MKQSQFNKISREVLSYAKEYDLDLVIQEDGENVVICAELDYEDFEPICDMVQNLGFECEMEDSGRLVVYNH